MADQKNSFGKVIGCFFYFFFFLFFILIIMSALFFNFRIFAPRFPSFFGILFILFIFFIFFVIYSISEKSKKGAGKSENDKTKSGQKNQENMRGESSSQYDSQKAEKSDLQDEQNYYSNEQDAIEAFEDTYEKDKESNGLKSEDVYKAFLLLKLNPNSTYTQVSERYYELTKKVHQKKISEKDKQRELDELERAYNIITEYFSKNS
ncbi:MAG TPA: hypothetical protein PKI47_09225 [Fervidobacterium sp.]|nr:hypothetical protein [Fervidobacterium sp.]HOH53803.1 hypothetical protein [Fervidobacterium sp.]